MAFLDELKLTLSQRDNFQEIEYNSLNFCLKAQLILSQLKKIGQLDRITSHPKFNFETLKSLVDRLIPVDEFYKEMGGVAGYFTTVQELLRAKLEAPSLCNQTYHSPSFIDISEETLEVTQFIEEGILATPLMAEMFALGGAADRLLLKDSQTQEELPAAKLVFAGKTLLQRLIEDIQAREYLYYQKTKKQVVTPIAIMTSFEKNNHFHILQILQDHHWFGRPKNSFRLFIQPLVPVVDRNGDFLFDDHLHLVVKPGGHGVLWKLAIQSGVFSWLKSLGKQKVLVRQINNPVSGVDYSLLGFLGVGCSLNKKFGFASCPRKLRSAEGMNVLVEKQKDGKSSIVLTNIEYCDFEKYGITDTPLKEGEPYSRFSSNTNVLFADLDAVEEAVLANPFPGLLLNLKNGVFSDFQGLKQQAIVGRLESTMQNIADVFSEERKSSLVPDHTFITYNKRLKTISTVKRAFDPSSSSYQETPESCFYELCLNARDLLCHYCHFSLPKLRSFEESLSLGPEFVFLYHPSLGPLYSHIASKILHGVIEEGSFLHLEIADVLISQLHLKGALEVIAHNIMGNQDESNCLHFSSNIGRCVLKNVRIENLGASLSSVPDLWQGSFGFHEKVEIQLKGASEFIAENITIKGSHQFIVEDGYCCRVFEKDGELIIENKLIERNYTN